jgi:hypothetical protein
VKLRAWIVVAACAVGLVPGVAAAAAPTLPTSDPFYTYTGSTPLASIAPGTVLKSRTIAVSGSPTMPTATELLYRTTGELGQPTVTVTTVIRPLLATSTKIISYQMAYDALGPKCDPSYTLQGGNMSGATTNFAEQQLISAYVAAGDTAVIPDYEGTSLDWAAGQESGAELASTYAPQLHIVGIGEGGIPVDMAHNLTYINGSKGWSGVIPAVLVAIARAFQLDLTPFSSAYGLQIAGQVKDECINSFFGAYPGLTVEKLLNSTWQDFFSIPHVAAITDKLVMGTNGTPTAPMFMGVGNADGTGDGVMIAADDEALAHEYCQKGVPVQFNVYMGDDHTAAAIPFEVGALAFLTERLNGLSVSDGCSSIGAGNALTPVTLPPGVKLRYGGPSTRLHGVVLFVRTKGSGALPEVTVTVKRGRRVVKSFTLAELGTVARKLVVRSHGHTLARGRYRVTVTQPTLTLATRSFRIR